MTHKPINSGIDPELLKDLEGLVTQQEAAGKPVAGSIEVAAARMQAVRMIMTTIDKLQQQKLQHIETHGNQHMQQSKTILDLEMRIEKVRAERNALINPQQYEESAYEEGRSYFKILHIQWVNSSGILRDISNRDDNNRTYAELAAHRVTVENELRQLESKVEDMSKQLALSATRSHFAVQIDIQIAECTKRLDQLLGLP